MSTVYLIPSVLHEDGLDAIPSYILGCVKQCNVIFAENERTTRRFLKALDKTIVIDDFEWHPIHKAEEEQVKNFKNALNSGKTIAIISEAGCPGIADPGQILIAVAQELGHKVTPLVGPSSILLSLMASGMNGQNFEFVGYLPIDASAREKAIRDLESSSIKNKGTKIFIETPYRNNQLFETLTNVCNPSTKLCIAVNITSPQESIITRQVKDWKKQKPELHKQLTIFLLNAG